MFWRNRTFRKFYTSYLVHARTLSIFFSDIWGQNFRKVFITASYTFRRTLWRKTILLKNLLQSFALWSKQFFLTDDSFFVANLSKLHSTTSGEHFDKKRFLKNFSSFFSGQWAIYFLTFGKNSTEVVETLLYVFRKLFEDADFFNCFDFWCEIRFWANFFLTFGTIFSVKLSKLLSLFRRTLWRKVFFLKFFFILFSDFERNIFWIRVEISEKACQNCILRVQKTFWGNRF